MAQEAAGIAAREAFLQYKSEKEAFVTGHQGTTLLDVTVVGLIFPASLLLLRALDKAGWSKSLGAPRHPTFDFREGRAKATELKRDKGSESITIDTLRACPGACAQAVPRASLEFIVLVLPSLLAMTTLADLSMPLLVLIVATGLSLHVLSSANYNTTAMESLPFSCDNHSRPAHLSSFRAGIMLYTCMAILAVDFPAFPRRYVKTETYGTSLMDLGVGAFVVSGGMVSALARKNRKEENGGNVPATVLAGIFRRLRPVIPVLLLGLLRIAMVWGVEYQEHVSEYGVHWNFFFTLGVLHLLASALEYVVNTISKSCLGDLQFLSNGVNGRPWVLAGLACLIGAVYQTLLTVVGWETWVLDNKLQRTTLLDANKEGVCSTAGFLALHLAAASLGAWMMKHSSSVHAHNADCISKDTNKGKVAKTASNSTLWGKKDILLWTLLDGCLWIVVWAFENNSSSGIPSRRMANMPYCAWVLAHNLLLLIALRAVNAEVPLLLESINRNQLVVFLVANPITGIVNLSMRTIYAPDSTALLILTLYMAIVCGVAVSLRRYRLKF